jgi:hypothetical protein
MRDRIISGRDVRRERAAEFNKPFEAGRSFERDVLVAK